MGTLTWPLSNRVELREDETELDDLAIRSSLGSGRIQFIDEEQWSPGVRLRNWQKKETLSPHQHAASRADRTSGEPQDDKSVAKAL